MLEWLQWRGWTVADIATAPLNEQGVGILHRLAEDCKKQDLGDMWLDLGHYLPVAAYSQLTEFHCPWVGRTPLVKLVNNRPLSIRQSQEALPMAWLVGMRASVDCKGECDKMANFE